MSAAKRHQKLSRAVQRGHPLTVFFVPPCVLHFSFKFAPEEFSNGTAFVHMAVEQDSELHFICPHPSLVLSRTSEDIPKSEMHENQWIVDKESFRSCDIETGNRNSTNKLNFECNSPATLKDDIQVFRSYGPSPKDVVFLAGKTYYFIGKWVFKFWDYILQNTPKYTVTQLQVPLWDKAQNERHIEY